MDQSFLDRVLQAKHDEIMGLPTHRDFPRCMTDFSFLDQKRPLVIGEYKPISPAEGQLPLKNIENQVQSYIDGGVDVISCLTDFQYFGGSFENLQRISRMTNIPVLCKDFIISEQQIDHARAHGASFVLLIVKAFKDDKALKRLVDYTTSLQMKPFVEVQNEQELKRAEALGCDFVLINTRNLDDLTIDMIGAFNLVSQAPKEMVVIVGSGFDSVNAVQKIPRRANGILVGSALMKCENPQSFLRSIRNILI